MHGEYTLLRQDVVHDGEHRLLDLAGVAGAADHHQMRLVVHQNGGLAVGAIDLRDALEAGGGHDGVVRCKVRQLLRRGPAQQLMDEQVLAGQFVDDAKGFGILGVCPGEAVKDVDLLILEIRRDLGENGVEFLFFHGAVHLAPCDIVVYRRGVHDELIVGAAPGVLPGLYHQRPGGRQGSLSPAQSVLRQLGRGQVAIYRRRVDDAQLLQSVGFHDSSSLFLPQITGPITAV